MPGESQAEDDLRQAMLHWLQFRCRRHRGRGALRLYGFLRDPSGLWREIGRPFEQSLTAQLLAVAGLPAEHPLEASSMDAGSGGDLQRYAAQIRDSWLSGTSPDWQELLLALPEDGNELVSACVASSLRECLEGRELPRAVRQAIEELFGNDQRWCDQLPPRLTPPPSPEEPPIGGDGPPSASRTPSTPADVAARRAPDPPSLAPLLEKLEGQRDPRARQLAYRLRQNSPHTAAVEDEVAWKRRLLQCLMDVDNLIAAPGKTQPWVTQVRDLLREILTADDQYVLLETQLLQRSLRSSGELAEAAGYVPHSGSATNQIVRIVRPGYALRRPDGSLDVLQRAKVLLAQ